mmetsp:Transcript_6239/g.10409  ORF Transcript_6239/g.10409 Transcript_6239/m.10409 type:complete len:491 (-) Transcript_6239:35-1507(-)
MACSSDDAVGLLHVSTFLRHAVDRGEKLLSQEGLDGRDSVMVLLSLSLLSVLLFCLLVVLMFFLWKDDKPEPGSTSESMSENGLSSSSIALGMVGSMLEMYDFGLYGFFTAEIGDTFFRGSRDFETVSITFATNAAGFLMRPLGAILLGYIADSYGRVVALRIGLAGMVCSTSVIGLLPARRSIGIAAPVLVVSMRAIQGLSAGGQIPGSFVYVLERAKPHRRCLASGLVTLSMSFGMMLASAIAALSHHVARDYSFWRLPFCLAVIPGAIAWWAGSQAEESEEYSSADKTRDGQNGLLFKAFQANWLAMLKIGIMAAFLGVTIYTLHTWLPTYERTLRPPPALPYAFTINTVAMAMFGIMIPFWGWLADHAKYELLLLCITPFLGILSGPVFHTFDSTQPKVVFAAYLLFTIPLSCHASLAFRWMYDLVPDASHRCITICTTYSIFMAAFAGTSPYVNTKLTQTSWGISAPGLYISLLSFLSTLAIASQ